MPTSELKAVKLGRAPRRDETFIKTHTRKTGVPSTQAQPIINKLKTIVEAHPELMERTIKEGDAFAAACGEKEPKGYIRGIVLGPTPQDVGTPGLKCYTPTRLQMEILARTKAERDKATLEQRVLELQTQMEQREQQNRASEEPISQHGSTSRPILNTRLEDNGDARQYHGEEDYGEEDGEYYDDDLVHGGTSTIPPSSPRTNDASHSQHDAFIGKEVILYALLRSDQPVAKGTIFSTRPSTIVGGQPLGRQCCEVIVTCVLKRDAILPCPYIDMTTMADADMMSIAWPYNRLKICKKAATSPTSGNAPR